MFTTPLYCTQRTIHIQSYSVDVHHAVVLYRRTIHMQSYSVDVHNAVVLYRRTIHMQSYSVDQSQEPVAEEPYHALGLYAL